MEEKHMEIWDIYDEHRHITGRTIARGEPFKDGEYYVCSEVWVRNSKGEFLITKRHPDKKFGGFWEFTGGGTLSGENTLSSIRRELFEETGILADESEFRFIATNIRKNYFQDIFYLEKDVEIEDLTLSPLETTDAKWVKEKTLRTLYESGEFVPTVWKRFEKFSPLL